MQHWPRRSFLRVVILTYWSGWQNRSIRWFAAGSNSTTFFKRQVIAWDPDNYHQFPIPIKLAEISMTPEHALCIFMYCHAFLEFEARGIWKAVYTEGLQEAEMCRLSAHCPMSSKFQQTKAPLLSTPKHSKTRDIAEVLRQAFSWTPGRGHEKLWCHVWTCSWKIWQETGLV